jgi:hypothetical protein
MRTTLFTLALLLAAACGGTSAPASDPGIPDAGGTLADAGGSPDAGELADAGPDAGTTLPIVDAGPSVQPGPTLGGCPIFPADNEWNRDISGDAVDAHSANYLTFMGSGSLVLQPDFGGAFGMPFTMVPADQAGAPMSFLFATQSDPGPYPFPQNLAIQQATDHHATVLQQGECKLYETYQTSADGKGGFHADSGAVFDLASGAPRPDGWTSATAAGLPILPGMARYDEAVEKGEILHALSFTAGGSAHSYVAPAMHSSGNSTATFAPPMGLRVRLKASFDLSRYTGESLVILTAMKKYGMFLTDNAGGSFWAVSGSLDSRWNSDNLEQIKTVPASAFEVVKLPAVQAGQ